jgi:hypothetical protein
MFNDFVGEKFSIIGKKYIIFSGGEWEPILAPS